jgi:hypothetical protein
MAFEFEEGHLAQMIPSTNKAAAGKWFAAMQEIFPKYDINTHSTYCWLYCSVCT